jgi:hypothetical protein
MHGKEEGKNGELQDCTLQLRQSLLGNFGDDTGGMAFCCFFLGWHSCRLGTGIIE